MPLENSTSDAARQRNIQAEIDAGKPPKQAVAIGYSVQREAGKKMADPVRKPAPKPEDDEHKSFFEHIKSFFMNGAKGDTKEIVDKGGPGGQRREKNLMDAVDRAMTGATDDE